MQKRIYKYYQIRYDEVCNRLPDELLNMGIRKYDYKYIILRIDKTNCFTPSACNDMTYKDLLKANRECLYYNEKEENERILFERN